MEGGTVVGVRAIVWNGLRIGCVLVAAFLAWPPAGAHAAAKKDAGKLAYLRYCSACHGEEAKGDGVVSGFLRPRPTNLTLIAKKNGGKFPFMKVLHAIDGTISIAAHGKKDMPVWGAVLKEEAPSESAGEAAVRGTLTLITSYLQSIQQK